MTKTALVEDELDGRAFVNQHVALVRFREPAHAPFVFRWLISPAHGRGILEKLGYGAGKPGLNLSNIRDVMIPLPSASEQAKAVARLGESMRPTMNWAPPSARSFCRPRGCGRRF